MSHCPLPDFEGCIHHIDDESTGVRGVIAIHSTALGPAAGGCRLWHYESDDDMVADAMRLARGMSYKNALAGLPFGGGKSVLQRPKGDFDRKTLFRVFGEAVEALRCGQRLPMSLALKPLPAWLVEIRRHGPRWACFFQCVRRRACRWVRTSKA